MRPFRVLTIALLLLLIVLLIGLVWSFNAGYLPVLQSQELPTHVPTAVVLVPTPVRRDSALPPTFTPSFAHVSVEGEDQAPTPEPDVSAAESPEPTVMPTLVPSPSAVPATQTPRPTAQAIDPPSPTASPTSGSSGNLGHACVDPVPAKPDYPRYFLPSQLWPTPNESVPSPHFMMAKPFPGGGRFLINETYPYGYDLGGRLLLHNGVDAAEPAGTDLLAVADGTIVVARDDWNEQFGWRCDWYGHLVVLELDQQWLGQPIYALYGHVLGIKIEEGQRVAQGEAIAEVGVGGAATVPHLHFEVRVGANESGATRNPMLWIDPATRGVIAGRLVDPSGRPWQGVGLSLIGHFEDASSGNTWSYLGDPLSIVTVHPDDGLAENFAFADVKPGDYDVYTVIQGVQYRAPVTVQAGQVTTVEIVTEAFKTPTPEP